jgi:hypothetical protein
MENMLTSTQVAERVGLSRKSISAYKSRRLMPAPDMQYGRTPLWSVETIDRWRAGVNSRTAK